MYKRLVEGIRKLRGRKNIDEAELKKERRYVYEKDAYAAFLHSISGIGVEDAYYLDFMIDLLRKEIKYSNQSRRAYVSLPLSFPKDGSCANRIQEQRNLSN